MTRIWQLRGYQDPISNRKGVRVARPDIANAIAFKIVPENLMIRQNSGLPNGCQESQASE